MLLQICMWLIYLWEILNTCNNGLFNFIYELKIFWSLYLEKSCINSGILYFERLTLLLLLFVTSFKKKRWACKPLSEFNPYLKTVILKGNFCQISCLLKQFFSTYHTSVEILLLLILLSTHSQSQKTRCYRDYIKCGYTITYTCCIKSSKKKQTN